MHIASFSIFSLLVCQTLAGQALRTALCFLTRQPAPETHDFLRRLIADATDDQLDMFVMMDDNGVDPKSLNISSHLRYLQIPNERCVEHGYRLATSLGKGWAEVNAWDKALLYFARLNPTYSFVWFVEDDVFIPSSRAFLALHRLYSGQGDLIVPRNEINRRGDISQWLWSMEVDKFLLPWFCSMVNVVGFSRRMLASIDEYIRWRGSVPFHEFFFNTLAMQLNFTVIAPTELNNIVYRDEYPWELVEKQPNNLYHPFKDLHLQNTWREKLINETSVSSSEIDFNSLHTLCQNNQSMASREEYLTDLLGRFNRMKVTLSVETRQSLRANFSALHDRCAEGNASSQVLDSIQQLANHAHKLPESPVGELLKEKSDLHRRLEEILMKNKAEVLQLLVKNASEIGRLREQAADVTRQLNSEIQREMMSSWTSTEFSTTKAFTETTTTSKQRNGVTFIFSRGRQEAQDLPAAEEVKMIVLLFSVSFVILVALWWRKIEGQTLVVLLLFYLLFVFCFYVI